MSDGLDADLASVAALGEPVRRELYRYVVAQDGPVGREQAAGSVGVAHHVAKFHLDRLVADGLLEVEYSRPPGRGGPGAGRPAKRYRRAARDIAVSLPERRYDLAGRVLAEAVTVAARDGVPVTAALRRAARDAGRRLAADAAADPAAGPGAGGADPVAAVGAILAGGGYEPRADAAGIVLANCPFHSLAQAYTDLVCGMNLHLIGGLLDALGTGGLCARLDPGPGRCCVTVGPAGGGPDGPVEAAAAGPA
ncbi:MAG TPA: transcriptional regulator [Pilimelia sp.]|nr:transcriptional regulator [Pilimelia sp.]